MEKTIFLIAIVSLSTFQVVYVTVVTQATNKHKLLNLDNLYNIKKSPNSTIDTSIHFESSLFVNNLASVVLPQEGLKNNDKIHKFPGQPYVRFDQYGGYVTVDQSDGRAYYYYFVEALKAKDSLPLLLWLNGGPTCSSLGFGATQELGPFRVNSDGKTLYINEFAWNNVANVLFVEAPAGVGFSYSNSTSDYLNCGDASTAADNYVFLLNWLERFPEYKEREFYISGESYAGHYVPQLAHTILYNNKIANKTLINLKGILIGNALINHETDTLGEYDYLNSHAIVSDEAIDQVRDVFSFTMSTTNLDQCNEAQYEISHDIEYINVYNIFAPLCLDSNLTSKPKPMSQVIDPCSDFYTHAYMNRQDVQEAIHANVTKLDHEWNLCSSIIDVWSDSPQTIIPLLRELMENNLRVWIFSGDADAIIPVTSTKYSINSMSLPIKTPWHPWLDHQGEMGGFTQVYEGDLTFSTVLGGGHQVPSDKPKSALTLVTHFLTGEPLDYIRH
uniref:serine carboxypeptidase-like 40 n=1 Tax=Erigeron canadensis TaxID=72917 RepID=UPI001CB88F96|nr:serine carboxypeptidase-like 40 [Erigeron canadensis]